MAPRSIKYRRYPRNCVLCVVPHVLEAYRSPPYGLDGKNSRYWLDQGIDYICALSDGGLFFEICQKTLKEINE